MGSQILSVPVDIPAIAITAISLFHVRDDFFDSQTPKREYFPVRGDFFDSQTPKRANFRVRDDFFASQAPKREDFHVRDDFCVSQTVVWCDRCKERIANSPGAAYTLIIILIEGA